MSGGEKIEMMDGKYSEQEINDINEIEQQLNRDCQYITIAIGNSRILQFIRQRKIEEVEKTYNGQAIKKIRFIVAEFFLLFLLCLLLLCLETYLQRI